MNIEHASRGASAARPVAGALEEGHASGDESEQRYRSLFTAMEQGFCIIEKIEVAPGQRGDFRYVAVNPAFERHTGLVDAVGKTIRELVPDAEQNIMDRYEEVLRTGESQRFEARVSALNLWMEADVFPVAEPDRIAVLFTNISDRKRTEATLHANEQRQFALLKLSDAQRTVSDPSEFRRAAMSVIGEQLGLARAHFFDAERDADGGWTHVIERGYQRDSDALEFVGRYSLRDFGSWMFEGFAGGEPVAIANIETAPGLTEEERVAYRAVGVVAFINVPLLRNGEYAGGIGAHATAPHDWTEHEIELIREVAARAWAASEHAHAEAALRTVEERFRLIVDGARDYAIFATDLQGRITTWPAGARAVLGWTEAEALGQPFAMTFTPEDRARGVPEQELAGAAERGFAPDVRWHQRKDGRRIFIEGSTRALVDERGVQTGFLKIGQDVTDRHAIERALIESESRFRQFAEGSTNVLWIRDAATLRMEYASPAFQAVYGRACPNDGATSSLRCWGRMVLKEDRGRVFQNFRRIRKGERVDHEFRIRRANDGALRWIRDTDFPLLDESGEVRAIAGIGADVTETKELFDRQDVLVAELQHRTRNLVAVVRSISNKTLRGAASLDEFKSRFLHRLESLARAQGLLSRATSVEKVSFDDLLRSELAALGDDGKGGKVTLEGPAGVPLRSSTVQTFALALHELATNALKYGALSAANPCGRLDVRWRVERSGDGSARLHVEWQESGVEMPRGEVAARGGGYGRELIERALPYQLQAQTTYDLGAEGVRCTMAVPISGVLVSSGG